MTSQTDSPQTAEFELPPRLDTDTAPELREDLIALRGAALRLDGSEVGHLGARCLAVLISAAKTWREDGYGLSMTSPSEPLEIGLARMGCALSDITAQEAAQ